MRRIPVHIVTGGQRSGKTSLIARLCRERSDWLGLVDAPPADPGPNVRLLSPGCPCCTGKVVLQVTLVRALRETKAARAFVEVSGSAHAENLEKALAEIPFSLSLEGARTLFVPQDAGLRASDLQG